MSRLDDLIEAHQLFIIKRDAGPEIEAGKVRVVDEGRSKIPGSRPRYRVVLINEGVQP